MTLQRGDLVRVADDLGPSMGHFPAGGEAIVIGSYRDQFGHGAADTYMVHIRGHGEVAWYDERQLTLVERGRVDLLEAWQQARADERARKGDLDWIFAHGAEVIAQPHGASVEALARCFGVENLWGPNGEGFTYAINAQRTLAFAAPWLKAGDKDGWLRSCQDWMQRSKGAES